MNPFYDQKLLYQTLAELQVIGQKELDEVWKNCQVNGADLGDTLVSKDLISDDNLGQLISDMIKIPLVRLSKEAEPSDEVLRLVPEVVAKKQQMMSFKQDKDGVSLAMVNPANKEVVEFLAKKTGQNIKVYLTTKREFNQAMGWYRKDLQQTFDEMLAEQVNKATSGSDWEAPVTKIVDLLIEYAYGNRASDIHIEPERSDSIVRFRIDGVLHDMLKLPKTLHEQVVSKIKVASRLRTDEKMSAQDGKTKANVSGEEVDIRISVVPVINGEKIVMRLLSSKTRQFGLADLGMGEADLKKVKNGFEKPYGMVLSTGPTGSGKTTTIYAILKILNVRDINIATIEDPVEYDVEGINQIQVNAKTNLTFANGLRAILRQDPNIIFVGEIRDAETADIAVNSAMTGHLVLSTLHTNDSATTLPRMMDMGIEPYLVASTINVIIGQRLVRKICERCRVSEESGVDDLVKYFPKELLAKCFGKKKAARVYQGKGCPVCQNTGYVGRLGLFEVLEVSDKIKELIMAREDASKIKKAAMSEGMTDMVEDGLNKVIAGMTTIEEVMRVTKA